MSTKNDFRSLARRFIPSNTYNKMRNIANFFATLRTEGYSMWKFLSVHDETCASIELKQLKHPFLIRRSYYHTEGILQNVIRKEWDHIKPKTSPPKLIIDAGAFIGDLTCFWATKYPNCRIIALEPNMENFLFASQNTKPYENIDAVCCGLWSSVTSLGISGSDMNCKVIKDANHTGQRVDLVDIPLLVSRYKIDSIDVLKIDIEGAESQVFDESAKSWIHMVQLIIIEFHGEEIEKHITAFLVSSGFRSKRYRSLVYFYRQA